MAAGAGVGAGIGAGFGWGCGWGIGCGTGWAIMPVQPPAVTIEPQQPQLLLA
jgi:hypothetical protein